MNSKHFNWKIGGKAGEGIAATTFLMAKIAQRAGLYVFEYGEYPSLIRGGHTTGQVHASTELISCQKRMVDLMVVLNEDCIRLHLEEFGDSTKFLVDTQDDKIDFSKYSQIKPDQVVSVPMVQLAREATGKSLASNMVALAVTCHLLELPLPTLEQVIYDFFIKKGQEVVDENIRAAKKGYAFISSGESTLLSQPPTTAVEESTLHSNPPTAKNLFEKNSVPLLDASSTPSSTYLLTGTEAIGFGALSAGVQFYSAYPMTPSSALMTFMADAQENFPLVLKHAEDEIAAINEALGASFAGVRAMTGTAGGGFALMVEAVSLAGVTELPLVCMVGGRPGPATGLPTWTAQTDLSFVLHAGHGEFPKLVFTPGTLEECFKITRLAFLLTEKYHTQAYIIADKFLLESRMTCAKELLATEWNNARYSLATDPLPEDNSYRRFQVTPEGYSPRSLPGQPHGLQLTNSYEHDTYGYATEEASMTKDMVDKRLRKYASMTNEVPAPVLIGPADAPVTLVSWGSTRLVTEEVMRQVNTNGNTFINLIHILTMLPFKTDEFVELAKKAKKLVMVEGNATHQAETHIRAHTGIEFAHRINRYDGRPFYAEDIVQEVRTLVS